MPRWYLIGRLGRRGSAWAYFILVQLVFVAWILEGMPIPTSAAGAGAFIGCIISSFAFCAVFGWIVSMLVWKCCRQSQIAANVGFALGSVGILVLSGIGNARIDRATANAHAKELSSNQIMRQPVPDDRELAKRRDAAAMLALVRREKAGMESQPVHGNDRFLIATPFGPKRALDWIDSPDRDWELGPLDRYTVLGWGPRKLRSDVQLPAEEVAELGGEAHVEFRDHLIGGIHDPAGWVLNALDLLITVQNAEGSKASEATFSADLYYVYYTKTLSFDIPHACKLSPGQTFTWRIIGAEGHPVH